MFMITTLINLSQNMFKISKHWTKGVQINVLIYLKIIMYNKRCLLCFQDDYVT